MPVEGFLIVGVRIAEQFVEPLQVSRIRADEAIEVVVADLVAEVAEQRAVRLVHLDPQLLAVHVVTLGEIEGDQPVLVTGEHLLGGAGEQVEGQPVLGVGVAADDRQLELVQFGDQPAFGLLGDRERRHRGGVGVRGPGPGQRT